MVRRKRRPIYNPRPIDPEQLQAYEKHHEWAKHQFEFFDHFPPAIRKALANLPVEEQSVTVQTAQALMFGHSEAFVLAQIERLHQLFLEKALYK